jgi:UDP:flavonoid glycosyltransferase YjiC (YdhE family)
MTHGGLFGAQEAVYCGVPLVGIPIIFDQTHNVNNYVAQGFAVHLDFDNLKKETVLDALRSVIGNPR